MLINDHLQSVPAAKPVDISSNDPLQIKEFFRCTESGDHTVCVRKHDGMHFMLVGQASPAWMQSVLEQRPEENDKVV
ncbi:MAG: hypothetical protein ACNA8W_06835 [Bradymonadaceae bacterium]